MRHFAGLDIGGTQCAAALAGVAGDETTLLACRRMATMPEKGATDVRRRLFAMLSGLLTENPAIARKLEAAGISCGGPLDAKRGVVLSPPNLPGWDAVPITAEAEAAFGVPAHLMNDANACALVEWREGAARGAANMAFLTMGTGMGAGIIVNGQLIEGACGLAGEVGHIRLAADGPEGFGKRGSFEGFCGGGGIARWARETAEQWRAAGRPPAWAADSAAQAALDVKTLAEHARAGDAQAMEIFAAAGDRLGGGLAILMDLLNPDCIVIGSIFKRCEEWLRPAMERTLAREALASARAACRVVAARFDEDMGLRAAIRVALHGQARGAAPSPATQPVQSGAANRAAAIL